MNITAVEGSSSIADIQSINSDVWLSLGVELQVLRLDTLFVQGIGNKYFKLKKNIEQAKLSGCKQVLSFGGAFSNHIHALAIAGQASELATIGFIRGEPQLPLNATLQDAVDAGMQLHYLDRQSYRRRNEPVYLAEVQQAYPNSYIIPEGGSNRLGVEGCMEIVEHIRHQCGDQFDVIVLPCGTAATLAGVAAAATDKQIWGFPVLKNAGYLDQEISRFWSEIGCTAEKNWTLFENYHCGGYAKVHAQLLAFIDDFERINQLPLEPVYSGKMFYGLHQLLSTLPEIVAIASNNKPLKIVAVHTGGLQGKRGMQTKLEQLRNSAS